MSKLSPIHKNNKVYLISYFTGRDREISDKTFVSEEAAHEFLRSNPHDLLDPVVISADIEDQIAQINELDYNIASWVQDIYQLTKSFISNSKLHNTKIEIKNRNTLIINEDNNLIKITIEKYE